MVGYHGGSQYAHDFSGGYGHQEYLPEKLQGRKFYDPKGRGYDKNILERMKRQGNKEE